MSVTRRIFSESGAFRARFRRASGVLTIAAAMLAALPQAAEGQEGDITISFGKATDSVHEGDPLGISIRFSEVPDRVIPPGQWYVTIPLTRTERGGARPTSIDYYTTGSVKVYRDRGRFYVGFGFTASEDDVVDPGESVLIGFDETNLPDGFVVGEPSTIEVTILDGPRAPAVSTAVTLSVDPTSVSEGAGGTTITVTGTLNGATRSSDTPVTVSVNSGTATVGTDFATVSDFTLTIPADATSGSTTFSLTPTDDVVDEDTETLTVRGTTAGLTVDAVTLEITDNDAAPTRVILSVDPATVSEGAGGTPITVTGTLDGSARTSATSVTVSVGGDTATAGTDFATVSDFTLTIPADATSGITTFSLTPTDDVVDEDTETLTVRGTTAGLTVDAATLEITDNDAASTRVILSVDPATVLEGAGGTPITVTGTLDGSARTSATSVTVSVGGATATAGTDFATVSDFTLTIPANETSATAPFTLVPTDDGIYEGLETLTVRGTTTGLTVDATTITITDNDAAPTTVILSVNPATVSEGAGGTPITVTGTLDGSARTSATSVTVSVGGDTATAGTDFATVSDFTLTIPANETSATAPFTLVPTDDGIYEGLETLTVRGTTTGLTVDATTITITDNDAAPTTVILSVNPATVSEGAGGTPITVTGTLDGSARTSATSVTVSVGGDTATAGTDFATVSDFTLTIPAEATSGSTTFSLTPTDDDMYEGAETLTVRGTTTGLTVDATTITITDNDGAPTTVILSVDPATVSEGAGGTPITVTGTLDGSARTSATSVTVSVGGDTATAGTDFATVSDFTLTIPAEATSGSTTFSLTPTDDDMYEGAETLTVRGTTTGLTVDATTITITDNDAAPTRVILSVDPATVSEGAGGTPITVIGTLDGSARTSATSVTVSVGGDTATAGTDFATVSDFTLTIPAEATSGSTTFSLTPTDDDMYEGAETLTVRGTTTGLTVDATTITITDNDGALTRVILSVDPATVSEGAGETPITVTGTLDGSARTSATSVTVSVGGATATAGTDFATVSDFTLTIPAEATSGSTTFSLTPTDDDMYEGAETLTVRGTTTGLTVDATTITITDNDGALTRVILSVDPATVSEGAGETPITVTGTLDGSARTSATSVTVSVGGATATAGTDFATVSDFTLTIPAEATSGSTTFSLTPTDDDEAEGAETLTVRGRTNGLTVDPATLTITDNAASPVMRRNNPPSFDQDSYRFELQEQQDGNEGGVPLGYLTATDPDNDPISYDLMEDVGNRFDIRRSNGMVVYVGPGENYEAGPPYYELMGVASDPAGLKATVPVMVMVMRENRPPILADDVAETPEDTPVLIDVLANDTAPDGDRMQILAITQPSHGTTTVVAGEVRYVPAPDYYGPDAFNYTAGDGGGLSAKANVAVTVLPANESPAPLGIIPDQMLEEGADPVTLDLTPYFTDVDGDVLTFEGMSSDQEVTMVTVTGTTLTLTPVVTGAAMVTVTARDPEGLTATQIFSVAVGDAWVRMVTTDTLAALGRGYLSSVRQTVGRRLETGGEEIPRLQGAGQRWGPGALDNLAGGSLSLRQSWLVRAAALRQRGSTTDFAGTSADPFLQHFATGGAFSGLASDWNQALQGTDVLLTFGGSDQTATEAVGGERRWTVWGQGDLQTFRGRTDAIGGYEGDLRTGYVGIDAQVSRQWLLGVALARSGSTGAWQAGTSSGQLTTTLTTVHPYLRWRSGDTAVWAMAGAGRGTATNVRTAFARQGTSPLSLDLGLVEARRRVATLGSGLQIGLRGEAAWARLATGSGDETVDGLQAEVHRLRGGVEVTRQMAGPAGLTLTPFGAASARRDRGVGQTGTGLEVAGGVRLRRARVQVEAQGRRLILHSATGYTEHGVSLAASVGAGPYQEGLTLSVQPTWGVTGIGADTLWQDQLRTHVQNVNLGGAGVDTRIGYGLRLPGGSLLTPFGSYSERGGLGQRLQLGARVGALGQVTPWRGGPLELELVSERYARPGSNTDHRFSLLGVVTFNDRDAVPREQLNRETKPAVSTLNQPAGSPVAPEPEAAERMNPVVAAPAEPAEPRLATRTVRRRTGPHQLNRETMPAVSTLDQPVRSARSELAFPPLVLSNPVDGPLLITGPLPLDLAAMTMPGEPTAGHGAGAVPAASAPTAPEPTSGETRMVHAEGPSVEGEYAIQVIAVAIGASATALVDRLTELGYPAYVLEPRQDDAPPLHRVRIGNYVDRPAAEAIGRQVEDEENLDWFVVPPLNRETKPAVSTLNQPAGSPVAPEPEAAERMNPVVAAPAEPAEPRLATRTVRRRTGPHQLNRETMPAVSTLDQPVRSARSELAFPSLVLSNPVDGPLLITALLHEYPVGVGRFGPHFS